MLLPAFKQAKLVLRPLRSEIVVDGTDIANSVTAITVRASVGEMPRLELELMVPEIEVEGEVRVYMLDGTREGLLALGWTPPPDGACCDLHGRTCEPPSELCCHRCTEAVHDTGDARRGWHRRDGSVCANPDLSTTSPQ